MDTVGFVALLIGEVAGAATEDIAVERVTVGTRSAGCAHDFRNSRIPRIASMFIVGLPRTGVAPCGTLGHRGSLRVDLFSSRCGRVNEVSLSIDIRLAATNTYLSTTDKHMRVTEYAAVLTAAIDTAADERLADDMCKRISCAAFISILIFVLDEDVSLINVSLEVDILVHCRIVQAASAGTEDIAVVRRHRHILRTNTSAIHHNRASACIRGKGRRLTFNTVGMTCMSIRQ